MAPTKRKRKTENWSRAKKQKQTASNQWWAIKAIIAERNTGNRLEYLVDWDGVSEETGLPFGEQDREWRPERDVTSDAIADWKRTKAAGEGATAHTQNNSTIQVPAKRSRGRPRKRPVIESSSIPINPPSVQSSTSSSQRTSVLSSPRIRIPSPCITFDSRNPSSFSSQVSQSPSCATSSFRSTGVVEESETESELEEDGSASYIPTTQSTGGNSQFTFSQSHIFLSSTRETTISLSLEERPPSPALSIPETEPEASAEQSLVGETTILEDESKVITQAIPDTFEPSAGTLSTVKDSSAQDAQPSTQEELAGAPQSTAEILFAPPQEQTPSNQSSEREIPPTTRDRKIPSTTQERVIFSTTQERESPSTTQNQTPQNQTTQEETTQEQQPSVPHIAATQATDQGDSSKEHTTLLNSVVEEQHAQIISSSPISSTQSDFSGSILPTIERYSVTRRGSRHDSSQESPSSSPAPTSQAFFFMSANEDQRPSWGDDIVGKMEEEADAEALAFARERTLERKRRQESRETEFHSELEGSQRATALAEQAAQAARGMEQQSAQAASETGTRSPSTIPNQPVISQKPTSLRTVATSIPDSTPSTVQRADGNSGPEIANAAAEMDVEPTSPTAGDVNMEEVQGSDNDDDDDEDDEVEDQTFLKDDINLQAQEYIVPLPIQGRQADTYREVCKELSDIFDSDNLDSYNRKSQENQQKIEAILHKLRSIETHVDLIWGGNTTSQPNDNRMVEDLHLVQWSHDYSIKFRFLHALLKRLQTRNLHIIVLIEQNLELAKIIESFLRGANFSFDSPISGETYSAAEEPDNDMKLLKITILPSTSSRLTREAHLIVCLEGKPDPVGIRKKPWALKPDRSAVPLLHLVIPRTIGHIDRCLSTKIKAKRRQDTIIAALSQFTMNHEIGQAVDYVPPRSYEIGFADEVVRFLIPSQDEVALSDWPLPAIGSIRDVIEYESQQSQNIMSLPSESNAAGKRPLIQDDDRHDPAKRMRFTPQPATQADTSHISASTPRASLSVEQQRDWWKQEAKRLREVERSWVTQQWNHEEMRNTYKVLKDEKEAVAKKLAYSEERYEKLREISDARAADVVSLKAQVAEQQGLNSISDDEKVQLIARKNAEIDDLKDQLVKKNKEVQEALSSKKFSETTRDYVQERFREAQGEATSKSQELVQAQEKLAKLERAQKAAPLLQLHHQRQEKLTASKETRLNHESNILKKQLQVKSQEAERLKADLERMRTTRGVGGGTRAASAGPRTPRPGSRAASPLPNGGRDRLANLRSVG